GDDAIAVVEAAAEIVPHVRVQAAAVNEHDRRPVCGAPIEVMQADSLANDEVAAGGNGGHDAPGAGIRCPMLPYRPLCTIAILAPARLERRSPCLAASRRSPAASSRSMRAPTAWTFASCPSGPSSRRCRWCIRAMPAW